MATYSLGGQAGGFNMQPGLSSGYVGNQAYPRVSQATPLSPTLQPTSRPAMGYSPGGTIGIPTPQRPPARPTAVAGVPGTQVPTMGGMPGLAPAAGGYTAMPGGFSGTAPGLQPGTSLGMPGPSAAPGQSGLFGQDTRKLDAFRDYDPINIGPLGGLAMTAAGAAVPGLGLLNTARNVYNTMETNAYGSKFGQPLGFWQQLGGWLGLNDYGAGNISANGKTYELGSPNAGNAKSSDRGTYGGATGQARGAAPAGSTSMRDAARTSTTRSIV